LRIKLSLAVDSGVIGGVPMSGLDFGVAVNYQAVIDHACAFDFIDGGGLDAAFLGFGECDAQGNVNASKFGKRTPGCGGFIDISQNAKKVVFMGTFNSGGPGRDRRGPGPARHRRPIPELSSVSVKPQPAPPMRCSADWKYLRRRRCVSDWKRRAC
jgi:hypothetical protein